MSKCEFYSQNVGLMYNYIGVGELNIKQAAELKHLSHL